MEEPRSVEPARPTAKQVAASEFVYQLALDGDAQALEVIVALAAAAPTRQSLFYLGAGPLENLIQGHGDNLVDAAIRLATQHLRFKITLSGVWLGEGTQVSARTLARLTPWLGDDMTTPFE